ncbi:DapH/DapD/GlmU-related protein [Turneriella parva]|uniref:Transferase hexapeptide repeat containing protein n=1 Tax=Turneriella parva (strain ATCC BAA-1111 / DSM 21527 / NCTC 11395 / H) TaxID=869212 RepID=I4B548_TURPD|nr:DapH/DapD/GlmU-related protein [Turneriella parva]AFM12405.1 hypothetical protein Turpa_1758 [Turneriella parva DSM 21527]
MGHLLYRFTGAKILASQKAVNRLKLIAQALALLPLAAIFVALLGVALMPGIAVFQWLGGIAEAWPIAGQYLFWGIGIAAGFFTYGFSLMVVIPLACFLMRAYARDYRGVYFSAEAGRWYFSNALLYLVRYSFLEFVTPSPFGNIFYLLMGMKIGDDVFINTTHISDPAMISIGNRVTIGGSAVIVAHYAQSGYLIVAPVNIGDDVVIGLRATIMGDVVVGDGARVLANSVVLPKTRIGAGEMWGGVPAVRINSETLGINPAGISQAADR